MPSPKLICELSTSHGGERAWMVKLIESAAIAGFDYVKFQSFQVKHLKASDPQFFWMAKSELSNANHHFLMHECQKAGVEFLTTAFTADRVPFLHDLGMKAIKVGSGEGGQRDLLEAVSKYDWHIYLSTGLWTADDMEMAQEILMDNDVTLLHTVSEYPAPLAAANLTRMGWLRKTTGLRAGYSCHCIGPTAAIAAIAMGADAVEVHHSLPGAPRMKPWDKDLAQIRRIGEFARSFESMTKPGQMLFSEGEKRPFIGRWNNA